MAAGRCLAYYTEHSLITVEPEIYSRKFDCGFTELTNLLDIEVKCCFLKEADRI